MVADLHEGVVLDGRHETAPTVPLALLLSPKLFEVIVIGVLRLLHVLILILVVLLDIVFWLID